MLGPVTYFSTSKNTTELTVLPGEVPDSDSASDDKMVASKDKLGRPQQSNQVNPPEVSGKPFSLIMNAFKSILLTYTRRS